MRRRTYRVVETMVVRHVYDVEADTSAEAIRRATAGGRYQGIAPELRLMDDRSVGLHVVLAPT